MEGIGLVELEGRGDLMSVRMEGKGQYRWREGTGEIWDSRDGGDRVIGDERTGLVGMEETGSVGTEEIWVV